MRVRSEGDLVLTRCKMCQSSSIASRSCICLSRRSSSCIYLPSSAYQFMSRASGVPGLPVAPRIPIRRSSSPNLSSYFPPPPTTPATERSAYPSTPRSVRLPIAKALPPSGLSTGSMTYVRRIMNQSRT
ncbi:hypothetical protein C8Q76DRAFT_752238 [Earliella scabrosa]|nr:hypothetical protein C8Q76DRAFT_752238 [Earliella scabrosa]